MPPSTLAATGVGKLIVSLFAGLSAMLQQPGTGRDVLERMRTAYEGKWYRNLTFVQLTTIHRPDGSTFMQRWYESVRGPSTLRIDLDSATSGNGMLYTVDSTFVVRNGTVVRRTGQGNPFLPLIMGVYLQPVEQTARELGQHGFDLTKVRSVSWRGRLVWVVGVSSPEDSLSPQFWIDAERLLLVRMKFRGGAGSVLDAVVDGYVRLGDAWLGTKVDICAAGRLIQEEVYTDYRTDHALDDALFDVSQWRSARHWATRAGKSFPPMATSAAAEEPACR